MGVMLETWMQQASCGLSAASMEQVRSEIQAHYESACLEALGRGAAPEEAERAAVASLGDPKLANRQYRSVLLTRSEAQVLREARWSLAACSKVPVVFLIPVAVMCGAAWFFLMGESDLALTLLVGAGGMAFLLATPFLPIYTPARGRVVRALRWAWLVAILVLPMWPDMRKGFWLIASCLGPLAWVEWRLYSVRRKLPVAEWPKQLFL